MAPTDVSGMPYFPANSAASFAYASCTPAHTSSRLYVQYPSSRRFSQSCAPAASTAWSGPMSTALMRVEPSSRPRAVLSICNAFDILSSPSQTRI